MRDDASQLKGSTLEIMVFLVDSWDLPPCRFWQHFRLGDIIELRFPTTDRTTVLYTHLCVYMLWFGHFHQLVPVWFIIQFLIDSLTIIVYVEGTLTSLLTSVCYSYLWSEFIMKKSLLIMISIYGFQRLNPLLWTSISLDEYRRSEWYKNVTSVHHTGFCTVWERMGRW